MKSLTPAQFATVFGYGVIMFWMGHLWSTNWETGQSALAIPFVLSCVAFVFTGLTGLLGD